MRETHFRTSVLRNRWKEYSWILIGIARKQSRWRKNPARNARGLDCVMVGKKDRKRPVTAFYEAYSGPAMPDSGIVSRKKNTSVMPGSRSSAGMKDVRPGDGGMKNISRISVW